MHRTESITYVMLANSYIMKKLQCTPITESIKYVPLANSYIKKRKQCPHSNWINFISRKENNISTIIESILYCLFMNNYWKKIDQCTNKSKEYNVRKKIDTEFSVCVQYVKGTQFIHKHLINTVFRVCEQLF